MFKHLLLRSFSNNAIKAHKGSFSTTASFNKAFNEAFSDDTIEASDSTTYQTLKKYMIVKNDFLTEAEEKNLLDEVEPYMQRLRYEFDHWDNVIAL